MPERHQDASLMLDEIRLRAHARRSTSPNPTETLAFHYNHVKLPTSTRR